MLNVLLELSRRSLLLLLLAVSLVSLSSVAKLTAEELPPASDRAPVAVPHFPSALHAVVWRNWGLVPVERLAKVLQATPEQLTKLATSTGLPADVTVPAEMDGRGYITVLRRNWHLLPYEQLTTILDVTPEELAFRLREDDFLFHKLGHFKPACPQVTYAEPDAAAQARAAEIRTLAEKEFAALAGDDAEQRFQFVRDLSKLPPGAQPGPGESQSAGLRFVYSYVAVFGDPLSDPKLDPYPDGILARLRDQGVNGVWMHVVLRQLSPPTKDFPEFGQGHEVRVANLAKLVERAKRYGIRIYLYMNEPRTMPVEFFKDRPEMAGVNYGPYSAMCTSDERVRNWIEESLAGLFQKVPDLGGVFTITGSENQTHCASHGQHVNCPRCKERTTADIHAELITAIERGVHRSAPDAKVIVWDWGWFGPIGNAHEIIPKLPKSVWFQSVSEWALPTERGGIKNTVGEYSISSVGPGPRASEHWRVAKENGLKTSAKVQFNNTWELSTVPYLPVMDLVAEHCSNLKKANVDGLMLSWSLGGYPSLNLELAQRFWSEEKPDSQQIISAMATEHFGSDAAPHVRRAWAELSKAFREFPYDGSLVYRGPQQNGPSNLLHLEPTGYASTMVGFPYDDLEGWRSLYPADVFQSQFQKIADGWEVGLAHLRKAHEVAPSDKKDAIAEHLRVAEAAGIHFASVANQTKFVMTRDAYRAAEGEDRAKLAASLREITERESKLARRLAKLATIDSRFGYEASNHYVFVPQDLVEQVINCEFIQSKLD